MDNEYIKKAGEKLEYLSDDEDARRIAELIEKGIRDEEAALAGARHAGIAEGRAKGHAEGHTAGLAEGKIQIAKKMLAEEFTIDMIVKITGLTKEEIEDL